MSDSGKIADTEHAVRLLRKEWVVGRIFFDKIPLVITTNNIDPYKYLCDMFHRIKNTAKDELTNLVANKWHPQIAVTAYLVISYKNP